MEHGEMLAMSSRAVTAGGLAPAMTWRVSRQPRRALRRALRLPRDRRARGGGGDRPGWRSPRC